MADTLEELWRRAYRYHRVHWSWASLEDSEDFASYVIEKRLSDRPQGSMAQMSLAFYAITLKKYRVPILEHDAAIESYREVPEEEPEPPEFTGKDRIQLLKELDRRVVNPRSPLWERLARGEDIVPVEPRKKTLEERAAELLRELQELTNAEMHATKKER